MGILFGGKNESIVSQQREGVGNEIVQPRVTQPDGRLLTARTLLLAQDVGYVVGAEGASGGGFLDRAGDGFGPVLPDQFEQFGDLARQRAIGIREIAQVGFDERRGTEAIE